MVVLVLVMIDSIKKLAGTVTVGAVLLIGVFFLQKLPDYTSNGGGEEDVGPVSLTEEELQGYYAVYSDPYVVHVRTALNGYLDGSNTGMDSPGLVIQAQTEGGIMSGLDSFDRSYYQSKFVVYAINDNIAGGKEIDIVFQDKPDKMFAAWVYSPGEGHYDLRGFWQKPDITEVMMQRLVQAFPQYFEDTDHAL